MHFYVSSFLQDTSTYHQSTFRSGFEIGESETLTTSQHFVLDLGSAKALTVCISIKVTLLNKKSNIHTLLSFAEILALGDLKHAV